MPSNDQKVWQAECEGVIVRLANLLSITQRHPTGAALVELVRQLPRSQHELLNIPDDTLLSRCMTIFIEGKSESVAGERDEFVRFMKRIAALPPSRRAVLEACVVGVLLGLALAL